ncbi:MAG: hypothetical protein VYB77_03625 [Planctomycetota bacterium]|nr:hypothetical protein [Planctomycetota bacterium]
MNKLLTTRPTSLLAIMLLCLVGGCSTSNPSKIPMTRMKVMNTVDMPQLSHCGDIWISCQPTEEDLIWFRNNYITMVIDTRLRDEERGFEEQAYVIGLGMEYRLRPLDIQQNFTIRYFDGVRAMLVTRNNIPTLIHGETADRPAGVWMTYRVLDENVPYAQALEEAKLAGLNSEAMITLVNQYLQANGVTIPDPPQPVQVVETDGPDEIEETVVEVPPADDAAAAPTESVRD